MSALTRGNNRLAVLAAEIQDADGRFRRSAEAAAEAAIEAGHKLIEAKGLLRHGAWLPWLKDNCRLAERTAQLYMSLARSGLEIRTVADLGIRAAAIFGNTRPPGEDESLWWTVRTEDSERTAVCWPSGPPGLYHLWHFFYEQDGDAYLETTHRPVSWLGVASHLAFWQIAAAPQRSTAGAPGRNALEEHRAEILARPARTR